jgi:hypothetical protein
MRCLGLLISWILISFFSTFWVRAQDQSADPVIITSLSAGEAIRGQIAIRGNTAVSGFISWELNFGYASDTTGSWFLIAEGDQPIRDDLLAEWDTTTITDGNYHVRLTVYLEGDRRSHFVVEDLRVRNYTTIETLTPSPTLTATPYTLTPQSSQTVVPTQPPSETPVPETPTPLPTNPLTISTDEIHTSWQRGALGTLAAFLFIGLYLSIKAIYQGSKDR